tara:strand:+ start:1079 stop:1492 length:414 start_codon:yes stop_codon:yes gene_type:complete
MSVLEKEKKDESFLVAVYGSLRRGLGNHGVLGTTSEFLGEIKTKAEFSLYDLGYYPGIKEKGQTSIVMEVYKVTPSILSSVNRLEGYVEDREATFYDRISIPTEFGDAFTYVFVPPVDNRDKVIMGDWKEYYESKFK